MASLEVDHPKLNKHLKTPDLFYAEAHPHSTLASTEVVEGSDVDGSTHTVKGTLTIRGKAKLVTFLANVAVADGRLNAKTELALDRQDFGVTDPGRPDDLVQDNVVFTTDLRASKPGV